MINTFEMIPKYLVNGLELMEVSECVETIQTASLIIFASILRRIINTRGELISIRIQLKTTSLGWCEKLVIRLEEKGTYKYLVILEADQIKREEMKEKI